MDYVAGAILVGTLLYFAGLYRGRGDENPIVSAAESAGAIFFGLLLVLGLGGLVIGTVYLIVSALSR